MAQTDEELVEAVRAGDDRAYERLYERYQHRICAYVLGMVHDHGRAEDLTQDVFVSALRRMRKTERPIAFKPWIYEIAKNACIDSYRRNRRTDEVSYEAESGVFDTARMASEAARPEMAVAAKQQLDDLCGAFGGLSDAHHQILVLRELEGRSYAEIGEQLGMSRPSVESTLFRARRRLTEEYDELVSGERCIAVQQLLASGARIGRRDERRVERHVAHCVQCRRHAHIHGRDFVATRRAAIGTKVAAWLPIPAVLRRGGGLSDSATVAGWSQSVASVAEPALGWGKALAVTAAVLAAGGAGAVAHHNATHRGATVVPTVQRAPLHQVVRDQVHHASRAGATKPKATAPRKSAEKVVRVAPPRYHVVARTEAPAASHTPVTVGDAPRRAPAPDATVPVAPQDVQNGIARATTPAQPTDASAVPLPPESADAIAEAQEKLAAAVGDVQAALSGGHGG